MRSAAEIDYRSSHSAPGYADYYDETILGGYYGRLFQTVEVPTLQRWIRDENPSAVLDFACGTGRITRPLKEAVTGIVVGIDISGEMLTKARQRVPDALFIEGDLTRQSWDSLRVDGAPQEFDAVTAFRFFQNAGQSLRDEAMVAISSVLRPGGILIMNVQSNAQSPAGRFYRARARLRRRPLNQLSFADVERLMQSHGFEIESVEWYGHFPRPGRFIGDLCARLDAPARTVARRLHLPVNLVAQMFMVRARRQH